jgi:hypothetical protein
MQNDRSFDFVRTQTAPATLGESSVDDLSLSVPNAPFAQAQGALTAEPEVYEAPRRKVDVRVWFGAVGVGALLLFIGAFLLLARGNSQNARLKTGSYGIVQVPLTAVNSPQPSLGSATVLKVNGQLRVANSLVLTPTSQPSNPIIGQLYFDKGLNQFAYYNGQQFQTLGAGTTTATGNTTNITNVLSGNGNGVQLQNSSPGVQQAGNFNISGVGKVGTLSTTVITSEGGTLYVNPVSATAQQQLAAGTPVTVGLTDGSANLPGPGWANDLSATKVTTGSVGGTANSISVVVTSGTGTGHVQVGLYDDDGNVPSRPGNLLAQSAVVTLNANGTTTVAIPSITLAANTRYWLSFNTDDNTIGRTYNAGNKASCFKSSGFGFMPDPFGGCFFDNNVYSIALNYTAGGGASGGVSQAQFVLGVTGQALFQNSSDSTSAFQVQNAAGNTTVFNVDTVNGRVGIGKLTPAYKLDIAGGDINLSNGHSVRFGGLQALSTNSDGSTVSVTNFLSGGTISAQADNFVIQDANAATTLFKADYVNRSITIGNAAGDSNPVILYLANKNTAGDPTGGAEGGTYYNSTLASFRCYHTGFWQNCSDVEPQHSFSFYDDFIGSQTSFSGPIGSLNWAAVAIAANGSLVLNPATPMPSADRPGVLQVQTPAVANEGTTLMLGDTTGGSAIVAKDNDVKTAVAIGATTSQVLRVGLHTETSGTGQPVSGVWWEADPATSAFWRYCYGDGSAATCANSAVGFTANGWVTLEIRVTATGTGTSAAYFVINGTAIQVTGVTIDTTNRVSPALSCFTTTGSARNCSWDYFQFTGTTSTRR